MKIKILVVLLLFVSTAFGQYVQPQPNEKVLIQSKDILYSAPYFAGTDGYYGVGENKIVESRSEELAAVTAENNARKSEILAILKVLEDIRKQLETLKNGGSVPDEPKDLSPDNNDPPEPNGPNSPTQLDYLVFEIFAAKCINCHDENAQLGGLQLVDLTDKNAQKLLRQPLEVKVDIYDRVQGHGLKERNKTRMPKGGAPLSDNEVKTILFWMAEGKNKE